ncbi:Mov34/MPN/PAD-1 family protein [Pseudoduganella namucuonensis]|uniref:Mov34/MPN/PAD-1 family protein n=1 Tax=Pseudoduganella namucuonensis TaxID=1035707 RepID=UPI000B87D74F|nr:Mov34/MPN/PAD-1 family protein [Pseudoduganella namucuonensis]
MKEALFQISGATWSMHLTKDVVELLGSHAQLDSRAPESVGQLYARDLTASVIVIERATKLRAKSASRVKVKFDPKEAYAERKVLFESGLHCVGLWHTHPEPTPSPSSDDRRLARDYALSAKSYVTGIMFAIVGNRPLPDGLRVWVDDGSNLLPANLIHAKPNHSNVLTDSAATR